MDDLLSEDWQAPSKPTTTSQPSPSAFASTYSSFRSSPQPPNSGMVSPQNISRPSSTVNGAKSSAYDSFGNLFASKSSKPGANVSIQERQKQLLEEKRRQQAQHAQLWDTLDSGRATPEVKQQQATNGDDDDILAAFNKAAPVDNASYYPPPPSGAASGRSTPVVGQAVKRAQTEVRQDDQDDDPFGLGAASQKSNGHVKAPTATQTDDDDILGDLGKPVAERPTRRPLESVAPAPIGDDEDDDDEGPVSADVRPPKRRGENRALTELIDMGFPADTAKIALSENGGDVQGAVGWLLQQAHEESRQKARKEGEPRRRSPHADSRSSQHRQDSTPAWMRQEGRAGSATRQQDNTSPANGDKDATQMAQEFGTKFLKGANSLWKASQKQMVKTMAEFQQERDASQPKWMQETSTDSSRASSQRRPDAARPAPKPAKDWTNEAAMLDAPRQDRPPKPSRPIAGEHLADQPARGRSPAEAQPPQPKFLQQVPLQQERKPATKLSRQQVEDQAAEAYVSPARRKRPSPRPEPQPQPEPQVDLFSSAPPVKAAQPPASTPSQLKSTKAPPASRPSPAPAPSKPKAPPRSIPTVSPSALAASAKHRKNGGEAFKRGDYAAAHEYYTLALSPLPASHPIMIIVLSNRSLTALKTGDAKTAVADAQRALEIIGPAQGAGESIELGAGEVMKDMRDFYGKALMRKAEALEHMEKWVEAAAAWRQAVEAGVGGAVSSRGRDRCEKAASPSPVTAVRSTTAAAPSRRAPPPAKSLGDSMHRPTLTSATSAEAVKKLRAANAAAEKADDEKFALTDVVEARLTAWKGGKADNLRALLQSLDGVLWEGAGWKKVGMSDLVIPGKVKVVYMKAIGKVHPDKVSQIISRSKTW